MNKIDEQYFETVSGLSIRCSSFESANTAEILIENQSFAADRSRNIRHCFVLVLIWIILDIVIRQQAIFILLNVVLLLIVTVKCYILVNLIEFGKQTSEQHEIRG